MAGDTASDNGVLLVAHTDWSYWTEAAALAKSLRRFAPAMPIALVTNLPVTERDRVTAGFSRVVHRDFSSMPGLEFKWHLDEISPFRDITVFIDSDSICYGDISSLFTAYNDKDFLAFGTPLTDCHWFENAAQTLSTLRLREFPFFCGDFYLFKKTDLARSVFGQAREFADIYDKLGIRRLRGKMNDEPLVSLAMARCGVGGEPNGADWILQMQAMDLKGVQLDYAAACARGDVAGRIVAPRLVHFQSHRSSPVYFREKFLVHSSFGDKTTRFVSPAVGLIQSVMFRAIRRIRRGIRTFAN